MPMMNHPHPGLIERYDCLEPLGLSTTEVVQKLGISRKQLSDIVIYRSRISPEMAIRLDKGSVVMQKLQRHIVKCSNGKITQRARKNCLSTD